MAPTSRSSGNAGEQEGRGAGDVAKSSTRTGLLNIPQEIQLEIMKHLSSCEEFKRLLITGIEELWEVIHAVYGNAVPIQLIKLLYQASHDYTVDQFQRLFERIECIDFIFRDHSGSSMDVGDISWIYQTLPQLRLPSPKKLNFLGKTLQESNDIEKRIYRWIQNSVEEIVVKDPLSKPVFDEIISASRIRFLDLVSRKCPNLRKLIFEPLDSVERDGKDIIEKLERFDKLNHIFIVGANESTEALFTAIIKRENRLEGIGLNYTLRTNDDILNNWDKFASLRCLQIKIDCGLHMSLIEALSSNYLEELKLSILDDKLKDKKELQEFIEAVAGFKKLKVLSLSFHEDVTLHRDHLFHLTQLTKLRELCIGDPFEYEKATGILDQRNWVIEDFTIEDFSEALKSFRMLWSWKVPFSKPNFSQWNSQWIKALDEAQGSQVSNANIPATDIIGMVLRHENLREIITGFCLPVHEGLFINRSERLFRNLDRALPQQFRVGPFASRESSLYDQWSFQSPEVRRFVACLKFHFGLNNIILLPPESLPGGEFWGHHAFNRAVYQAYPQYHPPETDECLENLKHRMEELLSETSSSSGYSV